MTDINLPPLPDAYVHGGMAPAAPAMRAYATAAVLAERERCARLCERVINDAELGRGHAKGAAMCIELIRGKA